MPRITNPMMTNIVLGDMHNNLARMLKMQHQIATNKKYDRPSDNPVDVVRDLSLGTNIYENSQFIRNMDDGMTWLKNSEGAFNHVTSVAQRIRELAIYAGNGALEGVDMEAIATEMAELQEELRNSANFSVAGRYLLGGLDVTESPFVRDENGSVVYRGNEYHAEFEMGRGVTGQVSFHGREIFPVNERQYAIRGTEVPLDFSWQGRPEILQFQVGDRMAKVHLSELWGDDNFNGKDEPTDFNQFRDPGELRGKTLKEIADHIQASLAMGDVGRLVSVEAKSDPTRGVQWLEIRGHTGEPVRVTSWPETDFAKQPDAAFSNEMGLGGAWTAGSAGRINIAFDNGEVGSVDVALGNDLDAVAKSINENASGLWAQVKENGTRQTLVLYAKDRERTFRVSGTGGAEELFATYDYAHPTTPGVYPVTATEKNSRRVDAIPGATSEALDPPAVGVLNDTLRFRWKDGYTKTLTLAGGEDIDAVAAGINGLYDPTADPTDAGHALWAEVRTTETGARQLFVYAIDGSMGFEVSATGASTTQYFPATRESTALFRTQEPDHSHLDFSSLMRLETSVKSVEVPAASGVLRPAGGGELHFHLESGGRQTELIIADDGVPLTIDDLAARLRGVAGSWLDVTVESDAPEGNAYDLLGRADANAEPATKRLVLRSKDGQGVAIFDHNPVPGTGTAPVPDNRFAAQWGLSTATYGAGGAAFPAGTTLDPYMPALMEVSVGDKAYQVKLYASGEENILTGGVVDAAKLAAQIQKQVGSDILGYHVANPTNAASAFALYAKTGEPLRIVDLPFADPNVEDFSGGLARSAGMATGVLGGGVLDTATAGAAGLIRIRTGAKTVEISVRATDTLRDLAHRIKKEAGEWVDVAYYDPRVPDPNHPATGDIVQLSLASKDGSPLSVFDVSGRGAATFRIDTALRSTADVSGWAAAAGDRLTLKVDGYEHTIDLWDANAIPPEPLAAGKNLDGLVSAINARFQGKDVVAEVVDAGVGDRRLVLSSPRGYVVEVVEARTQLTNSLHVPPAALRSTANVSGWMAAAGESLDLTVDGTLHTITLTGATDLNGLVDAINAEFQGTGAVAEIVDAGGGVRHLVLSSPQGYTMTANEAGLVAPLHLAASVAPPQRRGGQGPMNQVTTVRTAANQKATDFFGVMEDLVSAVREEDRQGISGSLLKRIDTFMDNLLKRRTQAGAMLLRYETSQRRLTDNNTNLTDLRSKVSEPDLAEALTKFNMAQAVYQASLSTIARIVQPTLVDFLK